jgi:hypothetical protein
VPERSAVYQATQLGVESPSAPGTVVASNKRILDFTVNARPNTPVPTFHPQGSVAPTTNLAQKFWTSASLDGVIGYNSVIYILNSLLKTSAATTPAGATNQRLHTFLPATAAPDAFTTYTVEKGSSVGAERFAFGLIDAASFRWNRTEASLSGNLMGQDMSEGATLTGGPTDIAPLPVDPRSTSVFAGTLAAQNKVNTLAINGATVTYVLTYDGQSTAPIAVGATTATVQSELQKLTNIGANNVAVTGTPGTSYTITFTGILAGLDVSTLTISAFTGGPPTITATTAGGMAKLTRVSSFEVAIPTRYAYGFTLNQSDPSYSFVVNTGVDPTATLVLEHDSASVTLMTALRARTTYYASVLCMGSAVETLISIPYLNSFKLSFPFRFTESDRGDVDSVFASTYTLGMIYDTTFGGWVKAEVNNGLAAI